MNGLHATTHTLSVSSVHCPSFFLHLIDAEGSTEIDSGTTNGFNINLCETCSSKLHITNSKNQKVKKVKLSP
jgi:hypothetical protein